MYLELPLPHWSYTEVWLELGQSFFSQGKVETTGKNVQNNQEDWNERNKVSLDDQVQDENVVSKYPRKNLCVIVLDSPDIRARAIWSDFKADFTDNEMELSKKINTYNYMHACKRYTCPTLSSYSNDCSILVCDHRLKNW